MNLQIKSITPQSWKELQNFVSEILSECGYNTSTEKIISTVRGDVEVDVYAKKEGGIKTIVICECKFWKKNIPKTVVHSLRTVVNDSGATNGFIISKKGFQSGALDASEKSNVILLTWNEFMDTFLHEWLENVINRNHPLGYELMKLTTLGPPTEVYNSLGVDKQNQLLDICRKYGKYDSFGRRDFYIDSMTNKINLQSVNEIISESNAKFPVAINSYQDYFNYIYEYCKEGLAQIDLITGKEYKLNKL